MKKIAAAVLASALSVIACGSALGYSDVPDEHWSASVVEEARDAGIMQGRDDGTFGLGDTIKRSEFAAMLVRLMGWEKTVSDTTVFSDNENDKWYYDDINTLAEHGICDDQQFRPNDDITRREMAVMLVKALGYCSLAEQENDNRFQDVSEDAGYISVAYELGIINGKSDTTFDPEGLALREEGAAMMMRMYDKYYSKLNELHGFYAISSWGQKELAAQMDSVSFGWARLQYTDDNEVILNQTTSDGNDWYIPDGYTDAINYVKQGGASINLAVTMTDQGDAKSILTDPENRAEAEAQIIAASSDFDGVTIDFEGMNGDELKSSFTEFLKELRAKTDNKKIYVAVHPVLKNSTEYFNAYDYKSIGEYADKVILMAHDYAAYTLPDNLLNTSFIATPVTPFDEVYTALKYITDPDTGVTDTNKIMLALSTSSTAAWNTTDKKITDGESIHPSMDTLLSRLAQPDTEIIYSDTYKNPYAFYNTENGQQILIWYEDSRSVKDKLILARMFGINNISIWRIGAIPNGDASQYMDVWNTIDLER